MARRKEDKYYRVLSDLYLSDDEDETIRRPLTPTKTTPTTLRTTRVGVTAPRFDATQRKKSAWQTAPPPPTPGHRPTIRTGAPRVGAMSQPPAQTTTATPIAGPSKTPTDSNRKPRIVEIEWLPPERRLPRPRRPTTPTEPTGARFDHGSAASPNIRDHRLATSPPPLRPVGTTPPPPVRVELEPGNIAEIPHFAVHVSRLYKLRVPGAKWILRFNADGSLRSRRRIATDRSEDGACP